MFYHSHVNKDIFFDPRFRPDWILQPLFSCLCIMSHLRQMLRCGAGVAWIGKDFPVELQKDLKKRYFKDLSFPQWLRLFLSWNLLLVAVLSILCFFFCNENQLELWGAVWRRDTWEELFTTWSSESRHLHGKPLNLLRGTIQKNRRTDPFLNSLLWMFCLAPLRCWDGQFNWHC